MPQIEPVIEENLCLHDEYPWDELMRYQFQAWVADNDKTPEQMKYYHSLKKLGYNTARLKFVSKFKKDKKHKNPEKKVTTAEPPVKGGRYRLNSFKR